MISRELAFKIADTIASRIGIHADSDYRIRSGMMYTLLRLRGRTCISSEGRTV